VRARMDLWMRVQPPHQLHHSAASCSSTADHQTATYKPATAQPHKLAIVQPHKPATVQPSHHSHDNPPLLVHLMLVLNPFRSP
jgi:hypothetical protein